MISRDSSRPLAGLLAKGDKIAHRIGLAVGRSFSRFAVATTPVGATVRRDITDELLEREIHLAAGADVPVLITGQTLAGARRIARVIHDRHPDAHQHSFMLVSSDLTIDQVVALLQKTRAVVFEDVGAFGDDLQIVLMELLESQVGRRAGDLRFRRILSTALPDLYSRVEAGSFRKDLFYRLNAIHIHIGLPMTVGDALGTGTVSRPTALSPH